MDPLRLRLLVTFAVHNARFSAALAQQAFHAALRQYYQGGAFAGCVVKYDTPVSHLLLIGKQ